MSAFSRPRFLQVLHNDVRRVAKPLAIATLAASAVGLLLYLAGVGSNPAGMYVVLYPLALFAGGAGFTSTIFSDMHHPLERFHYLMLPCSNLERFLSRYLLSAPLFLLYATLAYLLFELVARQLALTLWDESAVLFNPLDPRVRQYMMNYLALHTLIFAGAIYFRSYPLIRTITLVFGLGVGLVLVFIVTTRIVYWDYFIFWFTLSPTAPVDMTLRNFWRAEHPGLAALAVLAGCLWVLYLAWLRLLDHEVQE